MSSILGEGVLGAFVLGEEGPPTIANPGTQHTLVGASVALGFTSSGATSFTVEGLPLGLNLNTSTGEITGKPTLANSYSTKVIAHNAGGEASVTFEWLVEAPAPPPEPEPGVPTNVPPDFEAAFFDLQDHLPVWWQSRNPAAVLYGLLFSTGELLDELAWLFEQPYLNSVLNTADEEGLIRNFAFAYGLSDEQLPPTTERLRAYIRACAEMDGSLEGLIRILMAIIGANEAINITGGTVLIFPGGGEGFTFPASGEGLHMFQFAPGEGPKSGLFFPANGEGLHFPVLPSVLPSDNMIAATGEVPPGAGPGLTFSQNEYILITQNSPDTFHFTVEVLNWLTFERAAFRRAIERYQPADSFPGIVVEVPVLA